MLSYAPRGCFIAETLIGEPIGHVFTVTYGKLGWIGYLIIDTHHRNVGIGTLLMKNALDYLFASGAETVKLEAVPEISDLYRKMGFKDEYDSLRFSTIKTSRSTQIAYETRITPVEETDQMASLDQKYFGANRANVLTRLFREFPEFAFVAKDGASLIGYAMLRPMQKGHRIGPLVCRPDRPDAIVALLEKCIEAIPKRSPIFIGVPEPNKTATEVLRRLGFAQYSKSFRMHLGSKLRDNPAGVVGIAGPMKG